MEKENMFLAIKAIVAAVCASFTAAFGWMGWLVLLWVVCMAADWLSGSAAAAYSGEWSSATARAGIWHKGGMIFVVFAAGVTDTVLAVAASHIPGLEIQYSGLLLPLVLAWYIFTELGSIAENAAQMGAPVPAWLIKMLAVGKKIVDERADGDNAGGQKPEP